MNRILNCGRIWLPNLSIDSFSNNSECYSPLLLHFLSLLIHLIIHRIPRMKGRIIGVSMSATKLMCIVYIIDNQRSTTCLWKTYLKSNLTSSIFCSSVKCPKPLFFLRDFLGPLVLLGFFFLVGFGFGIKSFLSWQERQRSCKFDNLLLPPSNLLLMWSIVKVSVEGQ